MAQLMQVLSLTSRTYFMQQRAVIKEHINSDPNFYKHLSKESKQWFTYLIEARLRGELRTSSFKLNADSYKENEVGTYEGEIDELGRACGHGTLLLQTGDVKSGTWKDNDRYGYGK